MQSVFHADRYMCHNADYNSPRYLSASASYGWNGLGSGDAVGREDNDHPRADGGLTFHLYVAAGRLNEVFAAESP